MNDSQGRRKGTGVGGGSETAREELTGGRNWGTQAKGQEVESAGGCGELRKGICEEG